MALSPMMQQYLITKEKYKNTLLFYRLGDFYEMFFDDAKTASRELELTLTGRDCGLDERAPMCGVPYHAVEGYIAKLIEKGYKVAICEQLTEPKKGVKLVERDVVRVITPGTLMDSSMLDENANNYIACVFQKGQNFGVSYTDISTGEFYSTEVINGDTNNVNDLLIQIRPNEVLCNQEFFSKKQELGVFKLQLITNFTLYNENTFSFENSHDLLTKQLGTKVLMTSNINDKKFVICSSGSLLSYLLETQKRDLKHINNIKLFANNNYMTLDANTRRNLEITETMKDRKKRGSLLWLLDNTQTHMGARKLKSWLDQPLNNLTNINKRLDGVEELSKNIIERQELTNLLNEVYDVERLCGKIAYGNFMPKDAVALSRSLEQLPGIKIHLQNMKSSILKNICTNIFDFSETVNLIKKAIVDNPPFVLKDGRYIRTGYNSELDELIDVAHSGKKWLAELEAKEKQETGIKNLKIAYNKVFGYYIEVSRGQLDLVPFRYQRKQTTVNSERFITEELKQMEDKILNAEDNRLKLEEKLFQEIRNFLIESLPAMQSTADSISSLDVLLSFATVAVNRNYIRPTINKNITGIQIKDGRHPVVEALLKYEEFIPNDTTLDEENYTMIITGPNMAGKSTYMRQVAQIVLLTHIGCFVPATSAKITLTDRIFTRVGASDDVAFGQSTFMVEMTEVSNILHNATKNSLVILDEVGRGTSTLDGLSIAWSVVDYISSNIQCKTLFSTHYHELTELEGRLDGVKNYRISVKEYNNAILFLRKIVRGGTNKSFGIEVANMAGLPKEVIKKAKDILHNLQQNEVNTDSTLKEVPSMSFDSKYNINEIINRLRDIDINSLSPLNAFDILVDLVNKVKD